MIDDTEYPPAQEESPEERTSTFFQWSIILLYTLNLAGFALFAAVTDLTGTHSQTPSLVFRAALALVALYVIFRWGVTEKRFYGGWLWFPLLGIWILLFIRLAFTAAEGLRLKDYPLEHFFFFFISACVIPSVAFLVKPGVETLGRAHKASFFGLLAAVLVTAFIGFLIAPMYLENLRLTTPTLNPITIGHLGVSLFILGWWYPRSPDSTRWRWFGEQIGTRLGALAGLAVVPLTASRGPIVSLGAVLLFTGISSTSSASKAKMVILLTLTVLFLGYSFVFLEENVGIAPLMRFGMNRESSVWGDLGDRPTLMADAWNEFLDNPITGSSIVEKKVGVYPHNVVVEGFMATGLFGGLLVGVVLVAGIWASWRLSRAYHSVRWIAQLAIQRLAGAMFSGGLYFAADFWTFTAAVVCVEYIMRYTGTPAMRDDESR